MNTNLNIKRGVRDSGDVFSAKKTPGTEFAEEHLARTYKRTFADGTRAMLIPPPLRLGRRGDR